MFKNRKDRSKEIIDWDHNQRTAGEGTRPNAKYGPVSESIRHRIPTSTACSLFCGGRKCKYCSASNWQKEQMTIEGVFSHWVTDNILAMARPTHEGNKKYDYITQFKFCAINSIINLQSPGEHGSCGPPLLPSGFSYNPQEYMDRDIFFYNFAWPDYDVGSMTNILDMVKVMQFALSEGKVAVHCHAGLGRTGVLIAAYLVFANRMDPHEAVHYVRSKRPGAIQTRKQVQAIEDFSQYLKPFRFIFSNSESFAFTLAQFLNRQWHLLHGFESRQLRLIPKLLHVVSERLLELANRSTSKVTLLRTTFAHLTGSVSSGSDLGIAVAGSRSPQPSRWSGSLGSSSSLVATTSSRARFSSSMIDLTNATQRSTVESLEVPQDIDARCKLLLGTAFFSPGGVAGAAGTMDSDAESIGKPSSHFYVGSDDDLRNLSVSSGTSIEVLANEVAGQMAETCYSPELIEQVENYKSMLNEDSSAWRFLQNELDGLVLSKLMWDWLDHLKEPVLSLQDMPELLNNTNAPLKGLAKLDKGARGTIMYLFLMMARLAPIQKKVQLDLLQRVLSTVCHQHISINLDTTTSDDTISMLRRTSNTADMKDSLSVKLIEFSLNLLAVVREQVLKDIEHEKEMERKRGSSARAPGSHRSNSKRKPLKNSNTQQDL